MANVEKIIKGLDALYDEFGTEILAEAIELIKEQQKKIERFELEKSWEESTDRMNGCGW